MIVLRLESMWDCFKVCCSVGTTTSAFGAIFETRLSLTLSWVGSFIGGEDWWKIPYLGHDYAVTLPPPKGLLREHGCLDVLHRKYITNAMQTFSTATKACKLAIAVICVQALRRDFITLHSKVSSRQWSGYEALLFDLIHCMEFIQTIDYITFPGWWYFHDSD